jgi:hypothetical protein
VWAVGFVPAGVAVARQALGNTACAPFRVRAPRPVAVAAAAAVERRRASLRFGFHAATFRSHRHLAALAALYRSPNKL